MKFHDLPQFTQLGTYEINQPLDSLVENIEEWQREPYYKLDLLPDFQRGHVWTEQQQIAFVEYFFKGGMSGRVLYFNKPSWMRSLKAPHKDAYDDFVIVDGLQRLTALMRFLKGEIVIFGCKLFEDRLRMAHCCDNLKLNINNLQTKKEVLQWYLEMNSGGTPHTEKELQKVQLLLQNEEEE